MVKRTPLLAGNWKMNLDHQEATHLTQKLAWLLTDAKHDFDSVEAVIIPSFTSIRSVQTLIDADKLGLKYGAQDVAAADSGAFTGDVSAPMLAKLGVSYVTVGHSERRDGHGETDAVVSAKAQAALRHGITPIICVGEGLETRQSGEHVAFVLDQVQGSLEGLKPEEVSTIVIAYEPVWAIGTGEVATPQDAQEVCGAIREKISADYGAEVGQAIRILYGGSVKAASIAALMQEPDVDGALVGGASLDADEFAKIVRFRDHVI